MLRFQGVRLFICNLGPFRKGAAMALPGIGIIIGSRYKNDAELLRHEYGHILQARKWGLFFFYSRVALPSFISALYRPQFHRYHWTEWTANHLSYQFFRQNEDWNFVRFPIHYSLEGSGNKMASFPNFCREKDKFYKTYLLDNPKDR